MSLVVCANRENDNSGIDGGIFEPWSFKNGLSSTYEIPANAQVGLHSCKINLNGTMTLSGSESMYQYFGEELDTDDAFSDSIKFSTATPIQVFLDLKSGRMSNHDAQGVADLLQNRMNKWIFHPNLRSKVDVDVNVDATTSVFDGYNITYDQYKDETTTTLPDPNQVWTQMAYDVGENQVGGPYETNRFDYPGGVLRPTYPRGDNPPANLNWNYSVVGASGVFKSLAHNQMRSNSMIGGSLPLSQYNGEFAVDVQNVNASGINWTVGLSRFANFDADETFFTVPWFDHTRGATAVDAITGEFFDYAISRYADKIWLQHTIVSTNPAVGSPGVGDDDALFVKDIDYWGIPGSVFADQYDISTNTLNIHKVRFKIRGQQVQADLIDNLGAVHTLCAYDDTVAKDLQLKPIAQSCWNLHPTLTMETTAINFTNEMYIETFEGCKDILDYSTWFFNDYTAGGWVPDSDLNSPDYDTAGWYEWVEGIGDWTTPQEIDNRYYNNDFDVLSGPNLDGRLTYAGVPSSGTNRRIGHTTAGDWSEGYQNILIMSPSDLYSPSPNANMQRILGFTEGVVTRFSDVGSGALDLGLKFTSDGLAEMMSNQSIFVRLDNFTQLTKNAFKGNHSGIIAHLPRFDGQSETGRLYYQPSEIAWVDLNNAHSLRVSSFDLSFCYVNEQYVTALTGQSIVVLMFRTDPSMK